MIDLFGCIANTVFQITSDPMTIAISINHQNYTNEVIKKTKKFSISILSEKTDPSIIGNFGYKSSRDIDKYKDLNTILVSDMPVLKNSCSAIVCEVIDSLETSTHTVFLGKVLDMKKLENENPMTYKYYHEELKGKSPKNAPTFIPEESDNNSNEEKKKSKWKCKICGYEVEMEEMPEDFVCPICGRPASDFEKIN